MKQSKFNTNAPHLAYRKLANKTIGDEIGDFYPVFYNAFAKSAQSAEKLRNTSQHTDQKRRFVVNQHDRSTVLFLLFTFGGRRIFLSIISIFFVYG